MSKRFSGLIHLIPAISIFLFLLNTHIVLAQSASYLPIYKSKTLHQETLTIDSDSGYLQITAIKPNLIKVAFLKNGDAPGVQSSDKKLNIRVTQNLDDIFFATDSLWVIITKIDLSVRFLKKRNEALLTKNLSYYTANPTKSLSFQLTNEHIYSLNQNKIDLPVDLKRKRNSICCRRKRRIKKIHTPIVVSSKGYALYIPEKNIKQTCIRKDEKSYLNFRSTLAISNFYFLAGEPKEIENSLLEIPGNIR